MASFRITENFRLTKFHHSGKIQFSNYLWRLIMDSIDDLDLSSLDDEPSNPTLSFYEIYDKLLANEELILTIPLEQEEALRKGLASAKIKTNKKLAAQNLDTEDRTLMFKKISEDLNLCITELHIYLKARPGCQVLNIRIPDKEI